MGGRQHEASGELPQPYDLWATVRFLRMGGGDPTAKASAGQYRYATWIDDEAATVHVVVESGRWRARSWGPAAKRALELLPERLGLDRPLSSAPPDHPALARLSKRHPGLHIAASHSLAEALVPTICQQKVTWADATQSWRALVQRWGAPAPGPLGLWLPPSLSDLAQQTTASLRQAGLPQQRAHAIIEVARRRRRVDALLKRPDLRRRLSSIPGLGPWTIESTLGLWMGDDDAIPPGDVHLPNTVAWALAGEARASDARMFELLRPWSGRRFHVMRLLYAEGVMAPRYGPKMSPRRRPGALADPSLPRGGRRRILRDS